MKTESLKLHTPLGSLTFAAKASNPADLSLHLCQPERELVNGMQVEHLHACVLKCVSPVQIENVTFECRWDSPFGKGSPEPGEYLDAQSWEKDNHVVVIGTEDFDALSARLPACGLTEELWPPFPDYGLTIRLPEVSANNLVSLHYVVASNKTPEPREASCWFAVDVDHARVLEYVE